MDALHRRAKSARRSLNGEVLMIFEMFVRQGAASETGVPEHSNALSSDRASRLRALAGSWEDSRSADEIVADIVRSRTKGREVSL